jgi:hypothetical protein
MTLQFRQLGRRHWSSADGRHTIRNVGHEQYVAHAVRGQKTLRLGTYVSHETAVAACEEADAETPEQAAARRDAARNRIRDLLQRVDPHTLAFMEMARSRFGEGLKLTQLTVDGKPLRDLVDPAPGFAQPRAREGVGK